MQCPSHDFTRRTWLRSAAMLAAGSGATAWSAEPAKTRIPRAQDEDFELSGEKISGGDGRRVLVADRDGAAVVGEVHVQVDDTLAVVMPDGRLRSVEARKASVTARPYAPISVKDLSARLSEEFVGFKVKSTRRFVYVYNTSEPFYTVTRNILEFMYPALFDYYAKRLKQPVQAPRTPLVVVMFRTDAEFQQYRRMPSGVVAYYYGLDNRVAMYEQSRLAQVAPQIAMQQAISTVAHEGVHQILANIGAQQRLSRWPIWISEGLAEYFAPTEVSQDVRWKGVGRINDLRLGELSRVLLSAALDRDEAANALKRGVAPRLDFGQVDQVIETLVRAENLSSAGYAVAWGLTHFLADRREKDFPAYLASIAQMRPLEAQSADERLAVFKRHFGSDMNALARQFSAHVSTLKT